MADGEDSERKPLLSSQTRTGATPFEWGPGGEADHSSSYGIVSGEEKSYPSAPPDTEGPSGISSSLQSRGDSGVCSGPKVTCRVCQRNIDITGREEQHVVKCGICKEATPIRNAPPGKKYVRCSCNCLLICKSSSQRIACPRPDCEKVINLNPPTTTQPLTNVNLKNVQCAHCDNTFLFNPDRRALAKCPYCGKVSAVGPDFIRRRSTGYIIAAVIVFALAIGVTIGTYRHALIHEGIFVAHVGAFVLGILLLMRAFYYRRIKVSRMEVEV